MLIKDRRTENESMLTSTHPNRVAIFSEIFKKLDQNESNIPFGAFTRGWLSLEGAIKGRWTENESMLTYTHPNRVAILSEILKKLN